MTYSPDDIIDAVAAHHGLSHEDLMAATNCRDIVQPRYICMFLMRMYTHLTYTGIADVLQGNRYKPQDHSTIIHGIRTIQNLLDTDEAFNITLMRIKEKIGECPWVKREEPDSKRMAMVSEYEKVVNRYV